MTNKIGIGIEASLDTQKVEQGVNKLGAGLDQLNKRGKVDPVSDKAVKNLDAVNQRLQQLLRVDGELRRRMKATGQTGATVDSIDWGAMYPDARGRARKVASVNNYLGTDGHTPIPMPGTPGGRGGLGGMAVNVAQAGLGAGGSVGGVAARALGQGATAGAEGGLSAGLGAGFMGLLGGLLALGVGKVVGGIMEKVGQAEDNNVAFDRLKRTLGDVNVSFAGLKAVVSAGAENLKVTYSEFGQLAQQFAKAGNVGAGQYGSLAGEVGTGVGLARSFGLDPSQGVGILGTARGMRLTSDQTESKRFALLLGETIGKSNAFAKAEEVFEAIGGYATTQTRSGMGAANVAGYAGMFSALAGSGIPGLDPAGAGGMLARINATLAAGGAKGEASQFFTAMVGKSMGLDPIQTQILREGGAFATNDEAFGHGSIASRYGISGPGGSTTFLQGSISELRRQYGGNKGLLAQATANHLGVNMRQAMALLSVDPNEMGEMQQYAGDLTKLSGSGIGNLSKVLYGSQADRKGVAESLLRRDDVSAKEKEDIQAAMNGKDHEIQKQVLGAIVAQRDQERTTGSDIRDSKNALDNIKTSLADKLVPLTIEMRHGIMAIAGGGKKSSQEIMEEVIKADSDARTRSIEGRFRPETGDLLDRQNELENRRRTLDPAALAFTYRDKPQVLEQKMQERAMVDAELTTIGKRLAELESEKAELLKKENERKAKELADLQEGIESGWAVDDATTGSIGGAVGAGAGRAAGGGGGSGTAITAANPTRKAEAMRFFMSKGWSKEQAAGIVANLVAESQLNAGAVGDGGAAYGAAQWHPDRQKNFERRYGKSIRGSSLQEQYEFVNYELTEGNEQDAGRLLKMAKTGAQAGDIVSRYYERPKNTNSEAASRAATAEKFAATPLPDGLAVNAKPVGVNVTVDPLVVRHENARGETVAAAQTIPTRVGPSRPFGH